VPPLGPLGELIPPGTNGQFDLEEGLILLVSQGEGLRCTTESSEVQEPARGGSTTHKTGKNPGSNNRLAFRRQKGRLITSQRPPSNPVWGEIGSLRFREQGESVCWFS
jgi:hypothetical protein